MPPQRSWHSVNMEQQEQHMSVRLVVVDPQLRTQCRQVEEQLLTPMAESNRTGRDGRQFQDALAAFRRIQEVLAEAVTRGPRVWTPNGKWEHEGLRTANMATADIDMLYALLRRLSAALSAPPVPSDQADLLAAVGSGGSSPEGNAVSLVGALARVLSLVDLTPDADTLILLAAIQASEEENVRLTYAQEDAWQRLAHRVTMLLTESPPLHRFLY